MNIYEDTPETEPRVQSMLGSKNATARALRSSTDYKKTRKIPIPGQTSSQ